MDNFLNAGIVALVYLVLKFAEMRIITKETKPIKELLIDMIIVYISVFIGMYIIDELVARGTPIIGIEPTKAFTDAPGF
jgi:hypothetical protein